MAQILLLNSGGLESIVAAKMLFDQGHELHSLTVSAELPWEARTLPAAARIAERFCKSHRVVTLPGKPWSRGLNGYVNIANMNATVLGIATCYASALFAPETGVTADSFISDEEKPTLYIAGGMTEARFRPNIEEYIEARNKYLIGKYRRFCLLTPVGKLGDKQLLVREALRIGLTVGDLNTTSSCLAINGPCGTCWKCTERVKAGLEAN